MAQTNVTEQIAKAQEFVASRNWASAEAMLVPLAQTQPKNPFIFYDLAVVYENTNRIESAKQIYQGLTTALAADQNQHSVVIRAPFASRMVSLHSLAQAKLNAIHAKQYAIPVTPPDPTPASPTMTLGNTAQSSASSSAPSPASAKTTPQSAPSASPSSAISTPEKLAASSSHEAVNAAMKTWAKAWANKDLNTYYASYTPNFQGDLPNSTAWKNLRRDRISRQRDIEINFRELVFTNMSPTTVQAQFVQSYRSNTHNNRANKTLIFSLKDGRWLIERETSK
jgi:hypothetical protein